MPDTPLARSALIASDSITRVVDGWEVAAGNTDGDVALCDLSAVAKILARGPATPEVEDALGTRFGRAAWVGDLLVTSASPGEWLALAPVDSAEETIEHFRSLLAGTSGGLSTVMDLTHGRALMRVSGPGTLTLLRRVTALDLDDRFVPQGAALRTSLARVVTDVVRDDVAGHPSYLLHCERSSGRYLVESLLAAGADVGARLAAGAPPWPDHPAGGPTTDPPQDTDHRGGQGHEI